MKCGRTKDSGFRLCLVSRVSSELKKFILKLRENSRTRSGGEIPITYVKSALNLLEENLKHQAKHRTLHRQKRSVKKADEQI